MWVMSVSQPGMFKLSWYPRVRTPRARIGKDLWESTQVEMTGRHPTGKWTVPALVVHPSHTRAKSLKFLSRIDTSVVLRLEAPGRTAGKELLLMLLRFLYLGIRSLQTTRKKLKAILLTSGGLPRPWPTTIPTKTTRLNRVVRAGLAHNLFKPQVPRRLPYLVRFLMPVISPLLLSN